MLIGLASKITLFNLVYANTFRIKPEFPTNGCHTYPGSEILVGELVPSTVTPLGRP